MDIVPIGKYKGQPVEILLADRSYCDWLLAQGWLVEKYRELYETLIAGGGDMVDTPEHNTMQARFLDKAFCMAFSAAAFNKVTIADCEEAVFEQAGWDVVFTAITEPEPDFYWEGSEKVEYMRARYLRSHVECKPSIGDNYPAVLRQVTGYTLDEPGYAIRTVLVENFNATGATFNQVGKMFHRSDVLLVPMSKVRERLVEPDLPEITMDQIAQKLLAKGYRP